MRLQYGPSPSLGLLHILEDTVSVLEGGELEPERRAYVLSEATNLLTDAELGSEISQESQQLIDPGKREALGSFMLLNRYLNRNRINPSDTSLKEVATVLQTVSENKLVPESTLVKPIATLRVLCEQMSRDLSNRISGSQEKGPLFA
jgi:hypothetical protein